MTKVIIDEFDTEEQAIAFVDWLKKCFDRGVPTLLSIKGPYCIEWDGIDQDNTNKNKITVNITTYEKEDM